MAEKLAGKKIAILIADGFQESEMVEPRQALDAEGAQTVIISPSKNLVKSWADENWSKSYQVDFSIDDAHETDFDALLLPGGVKNPDTLRMNEKAVAFIKSFADAGKPIAAICHAPWLLINAGIAKGKRLTSYSSIKVDLKNAGAEWVDEEVVIDGNLITSRKPADIPAFSRACIENFS